MKIGLLGFTKVSYMPYMHFYLEQIDCEKDDVHLIYWLRDDQPDSPLPRGVTGHAYPCSMSDATPLSRKLPRIAGYGSFARRVIREQRFDLLIVMYSTTAASVYSVLRGQYRGRYIFDYRDVTYEHIPLYRRMVAKVIDGSLMSFTSSDGFRRFLPSSEKLLTTHNLQAGQKQMYGMPRQRRSGEPIRIAFWGLLRHEELNRRIIGQMGGDERFELHYYGRAQGEMLELMERSAEAYGNVHYHGAYAPEEVQRFAENADVVHNLYSNDDRTMPVAMANKYYDGLCYALPQLCTRGSLMGDLCTEKGVGLACDPFDEDFAEQVHRYVTGLDRKCFEANCAAELARVAAEAGESSRKLRETLERCRQRK